MITDIENLENRYLLFVEQIVTNQTAYLLVSGEEFAVYDSTQYDEVEVVPFFGTKALAENAKMDDWAKFDILEIPLNEFIEKWLIGLYTQDLVVAGIWSPPMIGKEFEPLELIIDIITYAKEHKIEIPLNHYKNMDQLLNKIAETLR